MGHLVVLLPLVEDQVLVVPEDVLLLEPGVLAEFHVEPHVLLLLCLPSLMGIQLRADILEDSC